MPRNRLEGFRVFALCLSFCGYVENYHFIRKVSEGLALCVV